jgi:hypothetical protein
MVKHWRGPAIYACQWLGAAKSNAHRTLEDFVFVCWYFEVFGSSLWVLV